MNRDQAAVVALVTGGTATLVASAQYELGTLQHLGPGAFPLLIGLVLTTLGVASLVSGRHAVAHPNASRVGLGVPRAAAIFAAVFAFALLIDGAGLFVAAPALVLIASLGRRDVMYREALLLAIVLTVAAVMVFVWALGLPLRLWP